MGWMDFASDLGRKLFGGSDDAAAKIQEHIEQDNPGISDLTVAFAGGVATLTGTASSVAAAQKAVLMAGNVQGVERVDAAGLVGLVAPDAPAQDAVEPKTYVIQKGDTLWAIAAAQLGNGSKYPATVEANKEVIKNADLIFPGQKILIP